jgi:hypothetical protein
MNAANSLKGWVMGGEYGGGVRFRDAITGGMLNPNIDAWALRMGSFGH